MSTAVWAQVPTPQTDMPARPYRGVYGGNPANDAGLRHSFDATVSLASGVDRNRGTAALNPGLGDPSMTVEGPFSVASAGLSYARRDPDFSLGASASGRARYYADLDSVLNIGEAGGVGFEGHVGGRTRIQAQQRVTYAPLFAFNPFLSLSPADLGQVQAPNGDLRVGRQDSLLLGFVAGAEYVLGPRSTLAVGYGYDRNQFSDDLGNRFSDGLANQRFHTATIRANREVARNRQIAISYRLRDGEYDVNGVTAPARTNQADFSFDQQWVHSATRRTTLQVTAGAALVDSAGRLTSNPVGGVQVASMLGESWTIRSNFSRNVEPIQGLPEVTSTNAFGVGIGGLLTERFDLNLDAGLSNGDSLGSGLGRFGSYTATVRLGVALNRVMAVFSELYYYHYDTVGTSATPVGIDDWFSRHGFRVGLSLWAPLVRLRQRA